MDKIYHLSSCTTCRRILQEIHADKKGIVLQDIKGEKITPAQLDELKEKAGSYEALFSRRAIKYKEMGLKDEQDPGMFAVDAQWAAAVLPQIKFLQTAERLGILFKMPRHPFPAEIPLHFYCFEDCRCCKFLKIPFKIGGGCTVLCPDHEVKVAAHQAPAVNGQSLCFDKIIQGVCDRLLIIRPDEYIDLIHGVQCQNVTGVKGEFRLIIG